MYFYMCMKQLYWVVKSYFLLNVNLIFSCLFNMKQQQDSCSLDTQPILSSHHKSLFSNNKCALIMGVFICL